MCRSGSAVFGKADQVEVIIVVRKDRFGCVPQAHEKLDVPWSTEHGAGIELMGIGRHSFDFSDQGLPHSLALMSGEYREQSDHANTCHRPEADRAEDRAFLVFRDDNVLLSGVFLQALKGFRCPPADCVDAGIFAERNLLHLEKRGKICFDGGSSVNHSARS